MKPVKKNAVKLIACTGLTIFIMLLATNVWLSTTRHKITQQMRTELEAKIAKQKSVTSVRQIAKELNMIQSDKPVEILQAEIR